MILQTSAKGHKRTSVTQLQMVRYSPRSGHWGTKVCFLAGQRKSEGTPLNSRSYLYPCPLGHTVRASFLGPLPTDQGTSRISGVLVHRARLRFD